MPGKVKVRVLSARHLPVMDRSSENTDAFAEVKFGDSTHKTEVYRKSLNPAWNSEWFRFEAADDRELQDEPLQIRQVFKHFVWNKELFQCASSHLGRKF